MHTRTAVDVTALAINGLDVLEQRGVGALALWGAAPTPRIVPTARHTVHTTHYRHAVLVFVLPYECEFLRFSSELKRMAFFKSSCSSCRSLYLRFTSRSSRSSVTSFASSLS